MMQTLTVAGVIRAAKAFYKAERLTAQHPNPALRACKYTIGRYRCAIGAALTRATITKINRADAQGCPVIGEYAHRGLVSIGVVSIKAGEERKLRNIQKAHDQWAEAAAVEWDDEDAQITAERAAYTAKKKRIFLRAIGLNAHQA